MRRLLGMLFAALMLAPMTGGLVAGELTALARLDPTASSVADSAEGLGIDLTIDQPVPYRVFFLADPPRVVVDFREVEFAAASPAALDRSARVRWLGFGPYREGWSRLVAELDGPYRLQSAAEPRVGGGARISLRLVPTSAEDFAASAGAPEDPDWAVPEAAPVELPKRRQDGSRPLVVVLDPGHGGLDPGAEAGNLREAHLTLSFARELAEVLRRDGMIVELTRGDDSFVPLESRISIARAAGADLFLSLHADALEEGIATGATIYKLALDASERAAGLLAERHDRADLLAGVDLVNQDDVLATVLMDMTRLETTPRTDRLAARLAEAIAGAGIRLHRHPVQEAAFSVLKAPDIPSVLLELGFMSSPADRERLVDPVWRAAMAEAIRAAIAEWAAQDAAEARLVRK
ncbi:N-acetylmuramoyl-L-alanine amidase [Defluviimonas sp. WL0002]|uniref:N-acetylmuramoyl-L-alanine amidase n=1 Tax=Albidovulum marisflavi TaxID=2984159 RepID=A0ABT2ZI93_9RHOB|nr:N-acetylmuramoyl-L-alanine amidase [Defluviimonas sp. WL0002]MCV2870451.1 N-acetylmuramoyl-L-alanine amidase [Defluviimonas sp. WL0002]